MYKLLSWIDKDKLNWKSLSLNPNSIHYLEQNQDKIIWDYLSLNLNAIHLLEKNQDKIDWYYLSKNPNIFELDYIRMAEIRIKIILEELIKNVWHPKRIIRYLELGGNIDDL
jgi:hypothetical protein